MLGCSTRYLPCSFNFVGVFTTRWIAGTSENAGQDCQTVCKATKTFCDSTADWPDTEEKMKVLQETNVERRLTIALELIKKEHQMSKMQRDIGKKVEDKIQKV